MKLLKVLLKNKYKNIFVIYKWRTNTENNLFK